MSKAAVGKSGAQIGSTGYFADLNRDILLFGYLPDMEGCNYRAALEALAATASEIISEVYADLQIHVNVLRYIPGERRNRIAALVDAMSDLCVLASKDAGMADDCLSMLALLGQAGMTRSMASDGELDEAVELIRIGGNGALDATSRAAVVRESVQWGVDFAVGADEEKRFFLEELKNERVDAFLEDVWDRYDFLQNSGEYCGVNGCEFCSESYTVALEERLFIRGSTSPYLQTDYTERIQGELRTVIRQIEDDLLAAKGENDYLTDEMGKRLHEAVSALEDCGVLGSFGLRVQIRELCWYTPLDPVQIMSLQRSLNQLKLNIAVKEDGIYGKNTQSAWFEFFNLLEHGTVPTLAWIDPLQSQMTGITIGATSAGKAAGLTNAFALGTYPFIRFDPPHIRPGGTALNGWYRGVRGPIDYNHINIDKLTEASAFYQQMRSLFDHQEISDEAYNVLKNMESIGKVVHVAGKILLVAGAALDALELGTTMYEDLNDADGKLGKTTASTAASIGGRWAGAALGAKGGAMAGAAIGTAIFPGIGTAIGGAVLGLVGGIAGSFGGDALAQWIVDITCIGD